MKIFCLAVNNPFSLAYLLVWLLVLFICEPVKLF